MRHILNLTFALVSLLGLQAFASSTFADGFVCTREEKHIKIHAYNHTNPLQGTRNPAVMILADSAAQRGHRTLAKFTSSTSALDNEASYFSGHVREGVIVADRNAYIGEMPLEQLHDAHLTVAFAYNDPVENGVEMPGLLTLVSHSGQRYQIGLNCVRYLKGQ